MPNNENTTTLLGIDVSQFKRGLQDAQRQIKLANAEFKAASASMDKWNKSTEGIQAKIKQLTSVLDAENKKLEIQKQQLAEVEKTQGKNSAAANELRIAIANQEAAIAKTQKSLNYFNSELVTVGKEEEKANSATGKLNKTIETQQKELNDLKTKYAAVVLEQGKDSKEAQELAKQISKLSGDLATNKQRLSDVEKEADKFDKSLEEVEKETEKSSEGFTVMKGALAALVASGITLAVNGFKKLAASAKEAFNEFDAGKDNVIKATGATGEFAKELTKNYANVAKTVNKDMATVGTTLGNINTRFGFLGEELETATTKFLKFADITGTDAATAVELVSRAMGDAGIEAKDYGNVLDDLAKAAQSSGIKVDKLASMLTSYGAPMRALGFETKEAIAIFSTWEKAGVNTEIAFSGMKKAIGTWSKAGKDAKKEFVKVLDEIEKAPDIATATGKAIEAFGQKAGPDLADAIKGGRFEYSEFMDILKTSKGTVEKTFDETQSAGDKVKTAFNKLKVSAGEAINELMEKYGPKIAKGIENFVPKVEKIAKAAQKTVIPVVEKIFGAISKVVSFITKNFSTIGPVVMGAVTAFTAFNAAMAISKTITATTTAISALNVGVGFATKAQAGWNAAMSANPIGAIVTAVAALTAGIYLLYKNINTANTAHKEQMEIIQEETDAINEDVEAWDSLTKAQQEQINAGNSELEYYKTLKDELDTIVDRNGKVKEGYEARADFITSKLSEAFDLEIDKTGNVIRNYDDLSKSIDAVMEKKRAQIILDSQESLYQEAITKQADALKNLNTIQDEYSAKKTELDTLEAASADAAEKYLNAKSIGEATYYKELFKNIEKRIENTKEEMAAIETNYKTQEDLVSQYAYNIGQYEKNMELMHEGNYKAMSTVTWNYVKDYNDAENAQQKMLEDSIKDQETNLALLKKLKKESGSDIYDQQIKQAEKTLEEQKKQMEQYNKVTDEGLKDVHVTWSNGLDTQLSELTGHDVEFKDAGHNQVRMYVDGIATGKSISREGMADLVTETLNEISLQYTHAEEAGEDLIEGVNKGIANESKQNSVFRTISAFGDNMLAKLKKSLQEKSPSKATNEMGRFLLMGLQEGIDEEENATIKDAANAGKDVLNALNDGLKDGVNFDPLHGDFDGFVSDINQALKGIQLQPLNLTWAISTLTNKRALNATANALNKASVNDAGAMQNGGNVTYNFTQNNVSPKPLNRLEIYRQTKNQLNFAAGV